MVTSMGLGHTTTVVIGRINCCAEALALLTNHTEGGHSTHDTDTWFVNPPKTGSHIAIITECAPKTTRHRAAQSEHNSKGDVRRASWTNSGLHRPTTHFASLNVYKSVLRDDRKCCHKLPKLEAVTHTESGR